MQYVSVCECVCSQECVVVIGKVSRNESLHAVNEWKVGKKVLLYIVTSAPQRLSVSDGHGCPGS